MAAEPRILDAELAHLYALAMVAVARADDQIGIEAGLRLQQRIDARAGHPVSLEDVLLAEPIDPGQLVAQMHASASPFRSGGVHAGELAAMIVGDAISVALAKGYVSEAEGHQIVRFATALGCTIDEVRGMSEHLAPWLVGLG